MARIIVISDPHLSPTHGFFWDNWCRTCETVNRLAPDAVIVSGDLCINGPDSDQEVAFARQALGRLEAPVYAIPGNHDVGDEPPGQEADQIIDARRLSRWTTIFGADRFAFELGGWRVLGLNAQLLGSGLPQEGEQEAWLDGELNGPSRPTMLVLHKPLFLHSADEADMTATSVNPVPRARLLGRLHHAPVELVVSGHLHCHRDVMRDGRRHVWAPSTAFIVPTPADFSAASIVGIVSVELDAKDPRVEAIEIPGLVAYDLAELKGHGRYKYLRDMPACPPAG
jgi:3',5'-cyclic AMP phosphodiesterase CpdA